MTFLRKYKNGFVLSDKAVQWLAESVRPLMSTDFVGYIFTLRPKFAVTVAVPVVGKLMLLSEDPKKPVLSKRLFIKVLKYLTKLGFIIQRPEYEPFEEFASYNNIPFNCEKAVILPVNIFSEE